LLAVFVLQCLSEEEDFVDFSDDESLTSSSSSSDLATFQFWNVSPNRCPNATSQEFSQVEAAQELTRITLQKDEFDFSSLGMEETSHADGRKSGLLLGSAQFMDDLLAQKVYELTEFRTTDELVGCLDVFAIAQDPWSVHGSPVRLGSAESLLRRIYMSDLDMRMSAIKELNFKQGLSEGYHEVSGVVDATKVAVSLSHSSGSFVCRDIPELSKSTFVKRIFARLERVLSAELHSGSGLQQRSRKGLFFCWLMRNLPAFLPLDLCVFL
jgi:hypothetical protein